LASRSACFVALARDPLERDRVEPVAQRRGLAGQRPQAFVLHLPAPGHLLDDELRVHAHRDRRGAELGRRLKSGDQPAVLGDVVRRAPERFAPLGQDLTGGGVEYHRAVARRPGIAARTTVRLDNDVHRPDSAVRTRMRRQFSHRTTASGAATRTALSSLPASSRWHPSQRRCRSMAAPTPPLVARILS